MEPDAAYLLQFKNSKDEDNLKIAIEKSTKFIYESVKNGRYGTLNPNFNSKVL